MVPIDCVVVGFPVAQERAGTLVGSLLLGLYDDGGRLHHVGVTSSFTHGDAQGAGAGTRAAARPGALEGCTRGKRVGRCASATHEIDARMPGGQSRWSAGKDLSWEPLRVERVCEVKYDHMQGDRFRHAAVFQRWRPDKLPRDCRYDQLEVTSPYELEKVFGARP